MGDEAVRAFTRGYLDGYADQLTCGRAKESPAFLGEVAARKQPRHRRFYLYRQVDDSGVSGTGVVALGVQFPDGAVAIRWLGETRPRSSGATWRGP